MHECIPPSKLALNSAKKIFQWKFPLQKRRLHVQATMPKLNNVHLVAFPILFQLCTVENSTIMYCPTPNIFPYLPPEYQRRLNEDHTVILSVNATRNKRSTYDPKSSMMRLTAEYFPSLAIGKKYSLVFKVFRYEGWQTGTREIVPYFSQMFSGIKRIQKNRILLLLQSVIISKLESPVCHTSFHRPLIKAFSIWISLSNLPNFHDRICLIKLICPMLPNFQLCQLQFNSNINCKIYFQKLYLYIWYISTSVFGILYED